MSAPVSAPVSAPMLAVAVLDLVRHAVREGYIPLVEVSTGEARLAARVAYERGLVDFLGATMVPSESAEAVLRASDLAAGRFLVDLPMVARQDG